jgi:hypothetical protein
MPFKPPGNCPVCDEHVPRGLVACPNCGSCARSGWNADIDYDGLDLPDDPSNFDYDEFVRREFGNTKGGATGGLSFWQWVGLILVVVMVLMTLMSAL